MTRVAMAADLHVDSYLSRIDPASGLNLRELDFLRTTAWVARRARELECEALVVAGDFTESKVPPKAPRVARIRRALLEGPARQIHIRGNHDSEQAGDSIVTELAATPGWTGHMAPGFEMVGDLAVCVIPFMERKWLRAQEAFHGVADADVYRVLAEQYLVIARGLKVAADTAGARHAILVGHQQLAGGRMNDSQAAFMGDLDLVVDARALSAIGYAAVVFGHVHRGQTVIDEPACPVVFAGSIERVDFAEEAEAKSFLVVDVVDGRATIERVETPARQFVTLRDIGEVLVTEHPYDHVKDAVVRVLDLDPAADVAAIRANLVAAGAFEIASIAVRRPEATTATGGMSEALAPAAALEAYFAADPDHEVLVERGRQLLQDVAA